MRSRFRGIATVLIVLLLGACGYSPAAQQRADGTASAARTGAGSPTPSASASPQAWGEISLTCSPNKLHPEPSKAPVAFISSFGFGAGDNEGVNIATSNGTPSGDIEVRPQQGTNFILSPSGELVTLAGQNGLLVTVHGADLHTSFSGSRDILTWGGSLVEIRVVQDFEGVVQFALGVNGPACYTAYSRVNAIPYGFGIGIPIGAPQLPPLDPSRLTASKCSGSPPQASSSDLHYLTVRLDPRWTDTSKDAGPTETRLIELTAPRTYGDVPTMMEFHSLLGPGNLTSAHSLAYEWRSTRHSNASSSRTTDITDCVVGGEPAALFGYSYAGQLGYEVYVVHKGFGFAIFLFGSGGVSDTAIRDALGMLSSIAWNTST
jgi:hypothetical protein